MQRIKYLIFDFDGVILDSNTIKDNAFKYLYKNYGKKFTKYVYDFHIKNRGVSRFEKFKVFHLKYYNKKITKNKSDLLSKELEGIILKKILKCKYISGVKKFINLNYTNYSMSILSATPHEELNKICKEKKLDNYFKNIYGSPKSKDFYLNKIILKNKIKKNQILYFGDSDSDYLLSKKFKIQFVAVKNNFNLSLDSKVIKIDNFIKFNKILKSLNN